MSEIDKGFGPYLRAIEHTFIRLRGTPFLLSPADVHLALEWYAQRIPVEEVLHALEEVMESHGQRNSSDKVGSLSYCRWHVARRHMDSMDRMRGSSPSGSDPAGSLSPIQRIGLQWRESAESMDTEDPIRQCVETFARKVDRELERGADPESIGKKIPGWRRHLFSCICERMPAEERKEVERQVQHRMDEVSSTLLPGTEATMRDLLLREELQKRFHLPRLFA
ncbi:MAG TPA: hypothetical protein PK014_05360 [Thermoanaerobaculia bacterium]|nr:hypothetical protein [Thermoanaerobaculia bacterium]HUM28748.1 hypothetical protein [Thermoanaerobaculia bacterium]HXK68002.1 hypothetical protein [Thermoanaerobaculia bacterium]